MSNLPITLTNYRHEDAKVHNARHAAPGGSETNDKANGNHGHEEQNEWGSLLASIRNPCCNDSYNCGCNIDWYL